MKKYLLSSFALLFAVVMVLQSCGTPKTVAATPTEPLEATPSEYAAAKLPIWANAKDSARIAFYNVENLFDTLDAPDIDDSEFLPNSKSMWTRVRYEAKLKQIAKVVDSLGFPSIMGMVEVENRRVLDDLTIKTALKAQNYGVVHFESPDERGIDCALIYKKADFQVKNAKPHKIVFPNNDPDRTRDILEVSGILRGTAVTVFVNHWPSRSGGAEESAPKRIFVAQVLKRAVDSVMKTDANARIVIMGDLNDDPSDKSLTEGLEAKQWDRNTSNELIVNGLYNLASGVKRDGLGSYYYQKNWEVIDQIIVSGNLLAENSTLVTQDQESIFKEDFITYLEKKSGLRLPNRTYTGPIYRGGFSDHFPVYVSVFLKK